MYITYFYLLRVVCKEIISVLLQFYTLAVCVLMCGVLSAGGCGVYISMCVCHTPVPPAPSGHRWTCARRTDMCAVFDDV